MFLNKYVLVLVDVWSRLLWRSFNSRVAHYDNKYWSLTSTNSRHVLVFVENKHRDLLEQSEHNRRHDRFGALHSGCMSHSQCNLFHSESWSNSPRGNDPLSGSDPLYYRSGSDLFIWLDLRYYRFGADPWSVVLLVCQIYIINKLIYFGICTCRHNLHHNNFNLLTYIIHWNSNNLWSFTYLL